MSYHLYNKEDPCKNITLIVAPIIIIITSSPKHILFTLMHAWLRLYFFSPCISVPHLTSFLRFAAASSTILLFWLSLFEYSSFFYYTMPSVIAKVKTQIELWKVGKYTKRRSYLPEYEPRGKCIINHLYKHKIKALSYYIIRQGSLSTILS